MVQQGGSGQRQEEQRREAIDASTSPSHPLVLQYELQLACRPVYPIPPSLCYTMSCSVSYVMFCYFMFHFDLFRVSTTSLPQHAAYCTPWLSSAHVTVTVPGARLGSDFAFHHIRSIFNCKEKYSSLRSGVTGIVSILIYLILFHVMLCYIMLCSFI